MKKLLLLSSIFLSKTLFAGKALKAFISSCTLIAIYGGSYLLPSSNLEPVTINPYNYFFLPTKLANDNCILVNVPTLQEEITHNSKDDQRVAHAAYSAINSYKTKQNQLRGLTDSMNDCPKYGYSKLYERENLSGSNLYILGPKAWIPPEQLQTDLNILGYKKITPTSVDASYTDTTAITTCSGHPDPNIFGCLFILSFGHGEHNSKRALNMAKDLGQTLREKNLLEKFDIEMSKCISDPNIPVQRLYCTDSGDCVAVAFRFIGINRESVLEAEKEILEVINHYAPKEFHIENPLKCTLKNDMCCAVNNFEKIEL